MPTLLPFQTERLLLRPLQADDAPGMLELDSNPAVHRYLGGIGGSMAATLAESEAVIPAFPLATSTEVVG